MTLTPSLRRTLRWCWSRGRSPTGDPFTVTVPERVSRYPEPSRPQLQRAVRIKTGMDQDGHGSPRGPPSPELEDDRVVRLGVPEEVAFLAGARQRVGQLPAQDRVISPMRIRVRRALTAGPPPHPAL